MKREQLSATGVIVGLIFFSFSFTPTLIPRDWIFQGIASGMSLICGYGLGAALGWAARKTGLHRRINETTRRGAWNVIGVLVLVTAVLMMIFGTGWQNDLRALMNMPAVEASYFLVLVIALLLAFFIYMVARGVRRAGVALGRWIGRWLPPLPAMVIGGLVVGFLVVLSLNGLIYGWLIGTMNDVYAEVDRGTPEGVSRPLVAERSGSPSSLAPWDTLGFRGREFVGTGRTNEEIAAFAAAIGRDVEVKTPIRIYAGLASTQSRDLEDVAALVVAELDRTNAWDREILVVGTATGTGWVDPGMVEALELMHAGDTAIATMQYSYLPSWISFVADRITPPKAGRILFDTVYAAWEARPVDSRPTLIAFGVSLGSFGGQGAFDDLNDMVSKTDGAMWIGTPNFAGVWRELTDGRDPGSFERSPIYRGGVDARWGTEIGSATNVWDLGSRWEHPRVIYVQHASDGVTWWSFDLIFNRPDWMTEPPGPDVLPTLRWLPFVTFWQITMDMFVAGNVPPGHGHNYTLVYADAWEAVAPPNGWTNADTAALRAAMAELLHND